MTSSANSSANSSTKKLHSFINKSASPVPWGTRVEKERKNRISVALAAYSYEVLDHSIMEDSTFDKLCREIDPSIDTGRPDLDKFFREKFDPSTGMWIHQHPELEKVKALYDRLYGR